MARKKFKKLYELKVIEHRTVRVEADSAEAAINWATGKNTRYDSARPIRDDNFQPIKKVLKRSAKVISEQDSADTIAARVKRQVAKELSQELCYTCGKTRAGEHSYDAVTKEYWGGDGHEYHSVKGMQRWFEHNKEWNKKHDANLPTEFNKYELKHLKELGISVA